MSSDKLSTYLIDPLAPIIVRSGRPFDAQYGLDAARFPPPSTLAGALRTAHADSNALALGAHLAELEVRGPLPLKQPTDGRAATLLVPKPADAHYLWDSENNEQVVAATPSELSDGEGMDLPEGLLPLQLERKCKGKPTHGPHWWSLADFLAFRAGTFMSHKSICANGWTPPADDLRTHVAIDPNTQANERGKFFQTAGLSFSVPTRSKSPLGQEKLPEQSVALLGQIAGAINAGVITLGGERRLAAIESVADTLWPAEPAGWIDEAITGKRISLTLLTPALFRAGWRPAWLDAQLQGSPPGCEGLVLKLRAAAVERWQPHSGWDLAARKPRAGRKLVPAGAVYWFEILESTVKALSSLWLRSICDDKQDCLDGFGLALPCAWQSPANF